MIEEFNEFGEKKGIKGRREMEEKSSNKNDNVKKKSEDRVKIESVSK